MFELVFLGTPRREILPSVVAISKYLARLCRPRRHSSRAHPREPPGSRPTKAASPRETDSPLEEAGFEPPVPLGSNTSVSTGFAGWRGGRSRRPEIGELSHLPSTYDLVRHHRAQ